MECSCSVDVWAPVLRRGALCAPFGVNVASLITAQGIYACLYYRLDCTLWRLTKLGCLRRRMTLHSAQDSVKATLIRFLGWRRVMCSENRRLKVHKRSSSASRARHGAESLVTSQGSRSQSPNKWAAWNHEADDVRTPSIHWCAYVAQTATSSRCKPPRCCSGSGQTRRATKLMPLSKTLHSLLHLQRRTD